MTYPAPGGGRWIGLGLDGVPEAEAMAFLHHDECGGIAVFAGTTRRFTEGIETTRLTYDAYQPMAELELVRIADEAESRWPICRLVLLHRLGTVELGETSVFVGVSTPHREAAFQACRWLIDTLKITVPIWKREVEEGSGRSEWVRPFGSSD